MKTALVLGAGGFIGSHLVKRLKEEGFWVRGVDLKRPEHWDTFADDFQTYDLRDPRNVEAVMRLEGYNGHPLPVAYHKHPFSDNLAFDEVYQLAADMGGAGYIFTGENDANVMHNSALINLNVAKEAVEQKVKRVFYSSSACMYPEHNQLDPNNPNCEESSAYPANPDSEYGWEKFAAICRKVAEATNEIEVWGDGQQTRSFLYVDECVEGILRLMRSDFEGPVNIGSDEMVTINQLVDITSKIAGKELSIKHVDGPTGVRGRNSDNKLIKEKLGWSPSKPLEEGLKQTFEWISKLINNN